MATKRISVRSRNKMNKNLSVHNNMVTDPQDRKKECPHPSSLGITISFHPVNHHVDINPSGIIPIIYRLSKFEYIVLIYT